MYYVEPDKFKVLAFIERLVYQEKYKLNSAIIEAEEYFGENLDWVEQYMINDIHKHFEDKYWLKKGLCPNCKELTIKPVFKRDNTGECMRCR